MRNKSCSIQILKSFSTPSKTFFHNLLPWSTKAEIYLPYFRFDHCSNFSRTLFFGNFIQCREQVWNCIILFIFSLLNRRCSAISVRESTGIYWANPLASVHLNNSWQQRTLSCISRGNAFQLDGCHSLPMKCLLEEFSQS